jgi:mono/diheme cytochrome c family protein
MCILLGPTIFCWLYSLHGTKTGGAAVCSPGSASNPMGKTPSAAGPAAGELFPKEVLDNPEYIDTGKDVFGRTCKFCHGKSAYPGKAPKLNPSRYDAKFVYGRVTDGFRGMPAMKDMLSEKERQGVVAYVLSRDFSN